MNGAARLPGWILLSLVLFLTQKTFSQTISPYLFGQNAWMPDTIGNVNACSNPPCIKYGKLHKHWGNIKFSGASVIRFGGIAPDKNKPTNYQYIKMIDSIRAKGMEPVMQVPFHKYEYTAQQAAAIVQYVNVTRGRNVKYWVIGNEPDLDYAYTSAAQVAAYFKPFASAMKAVDPTILTIGPETAWFNTAIINGLTTPGGPDDITGKDQNGRFYCDIISFHAYPFNGTQTRSQVISKLMSAGQLHDDLVYLNGRLNNCNTYHNRAGTLALRSAITEANVNYQNDINDNLNANGANSFIGGQFVAEMFGIAMRDNVKIINIWSVIEGNTNALNIGYIDRSTGQKKPMFYHFKMLADNFKGNYAHGTTNLPNVKAFGSNDGVSINVMILNQELSVNHNFTVRLNTNTVTGSNLLKINIAANVNAEYSDVINNQTTILLTFNMQGQLVRKCIYSLANHAALNLPPSCENFAPLPIQLTSFKAIPAYSEKIWLGWETASESNNAFFTVQKSQDGQNFTDLARVEGAGNSSDNRSYELVDDSTYNGTSYYRLKQTDYDGVSAYSEIRAVTLNKTAREILIYPNPNDGSLVNITIANASAHSSILAKMYDELGREMKFSSRRTSSGVEIIPQKQLAKGIYFLSVRVNDEVYKKKMLVK